MICSKNELDIIYQNKAIGSIGIHPVNEKVFHEFSHLRGSELGFVLSKEYWGLGLMSETLTALIQWLFQQKQLDFVMAGNFDWNRQSARVQEKLSFQFYTTSEYSCACGKVKKQKKEFYLRQKRHRFKPMSFLIVHHYCESLVDNNRNYSLEYVHILFHQNLLDPQRLIHSASQNHRRRKNIHERPVLIAN